MKDVAELLPLSTEENMRQKKETQRLFNPALL